MVANDSVGAAVSSSSSLEEGMMLSICKKTAGRDESGAWSWLASAIVC